MNDTVSRSDWPRNGTRLVGTWETHGGLAWGRFERGVDGAPLAPPLYLPQVQKGVTILFDLGPA